jgi:hypothetical protein
MHPRISEVLEFVDRQRDALLAVVREVPPDVASRRPAANRWSAAQVLAHLALVEGTVTGLFETKVREARATGLGAERDTSPILPTIDVPALLNRERALTAADRTRPPDSPDLQQSLDTLARTRAVLRRAIVRADGLALADITAPHPFLGALNLYQWIVFLGAHEARHTAQIREAVADARGAGSEPDPSASVLLDD